MRIRYKGNNKYIGWYDSTIQCNAPSNNVITFIIKGGTYDSFTGSIPMNWTATLKTVAWVQINVTVIIKVYYDGKSYTRYSFDFSFPTFNASKSGTFSNIRAALLTLTSTKIDITITSSVSSSNRTTYIYKNNVSEKSCKVSLAPRLPVTYQEVEYIGLSGTSSAGQFIRTGITSLIHPFSIKILYNKTNTDVRDQCLVGQRQLGKYPNIYNNYYETVFGTTSSNSAPNNTKTTIELKSGNGVIKDNDIIYKSNDTTDHSSSYELLIGAFSEDSYTNAKWFYSGYICEIEIINNGEIYRHYIPCYRKSDTVIGLFDLITQTFYTNSGTGTFTKGDDVNTIQWCKLN